MHSRLQVLAPTNDNSPKQDCYRCRNSRNCLLPGISDRHIVTNLLVCRLKRGIDVNRTTKLLLELLKPKLVQLSQEIIKATNASGADRDTIYADVQSETIYQLMHKYIMGEVGYPLHYLFNVPRGVMRRYVTSTITRRRKVDADMLAGHPMSEEQSRRDPDMDRRGRAKNEAVTNPDETLEVAHVKHLAVRINGIIDDGVTLRLPEYRVLRFCLDNATDAKRPLSGLHLYLARLLGVVRSRVTKIGKDALLKVRSASGIDPEDLAETFNR